MVAVVSWMAAACSVEDVSCCVEAASTWLADEDNLRAASLISRTKVRSVSMTLPKPSSRGPSCGSSVVVFHRDRSPSRTRPMSASSAWSISCAATCLRCSEAANWSRTWLSRCASSAPDSPTSSLGTRACRLPDSTVSSVSVMALVEEEVDAAFVAPALEAGAFRARALPAGFSLGVSRDMCLSAFLESLRFRPDR